MEFADGSLFFLLFLVIAFFGVVIGYFTEKGRGITSRAYGKNYSDSPGARARASSASPPRSPGPGPLF